LFEGFASLSAVDWLKKHGAVSEEDFLKEPLRNRLAILLSRTNHLAYHLGRRLCARNSWSEALKWDSFVVPQNSR